MSRPIAGDRVVNASDPLVIEHILFTIRIMESGGKYTQLNKTASASGAYQYIDSTWRGWAAKSGVSGALNYARAYLAPKEIQDAVAKANVLSILAAHSSQLSSVPITWYYPIAWDNDVILDQKPPGNNITVRDYAERWIKKYDSSGPFEGEQQNIPKSTDPGGVTGVLMDVGGVAGNIFTSITDPMQGLLEFIKILASAGTWIRVAQVVGGLVAVGIGIHIISGNSVGESVGNVAKTAAPMALV